QYFLRGPTGQMYDSKAIAGVAYGYEFPDRGPLQADDFSGGEVTVKARLEQLGFQVVRRNEASEGSDAQRNPPWIRDELILALDLYMRLGGRGFSQSHPAILECSELLNQLHRLLGSVASETLRNPNGVYMKLMNFRRFDPEYTAEGRQRPG